MAHFSGFTCDSCGKVVDSSGRTKKTVKFHGPEVEGEFTEDLCLDCVVIPEGIEMKPLRRRPKTVTEPVGRLVEVPDSGGPQEDASDGRVPDESR